MNFNQTIEYNNDTNLCDVYRMKEERMDTLETFTKFLPPE